MYSLIIIVFFFLINTGATDDDSKKKALDNAWYKITSDSVDTMEDLEFKGPVEFYLYAPIQPGTVWMTDISLNPLGVESSINQTVIDGDQVFLTVPLPSLQMWSNFRISYLTLKDRNYTGVTLVKDFQLDINLTIDCSKPKVTVDNVTVVDLKDENEPPDQMSSTLVKSRDTRQNFLSVFFGLVLGLSTHFPPDLRILLASPVAHVFQNLLETNDWSDFLSEYCKS